MSGRRLRREEARQVTADHDDLTPNVARRPVEATASAWYQVRDGKISDFWINWDWLAIMEAIGAVQRVEPSH